MKRIRALAAMLLSIVFLAVGAGRAEAISNEEILDQVIAYYNPQLAEARPIAQCALNGGSLQNCVEGELLANPDVQRMVAVLNAFNERDYPRVIQLAGVGVACAWVEFPEKEIICSDFAQVLVDVGAAAIETQVEVVGAVAELFTDGAATVGCWTGISSCGDDEPANQFNAAMEWDRCFKGRTEEGVIARLYGGAGWARLIQRELPSHRFAEGSLLGDCYPFVSEPTLQFASSAVIRAALQSYVAPPPVPLPASSSPFSSTWNDANPWGAQPTGASQDQIATNFVNFAAYASAPLSDQYEQLVEEAAAAALDEPAQDYTNLQGIWAVRAVLQGKDAFVATIETRGQMIALSPDGRATRQNRDCIGALSTAGAHMIDRWADAGAHVQSTRDVRGYTSANWNQRKPEAWCANTYTPAFSAELQRRLTAYDEALARSCTSPRNEPFSLTCPIIGSGYARCQNAFQGIPRGHCARATVNVRVIQPTAPVASEPQTAPPVERAPPAPDEQQRETPPTIMRPTPRAG